MKRDELIGGTSGWSFSSTKKDLDLWYKKSYLSYCSL